MTTKELNIKPQILVVDDDPIILTLVEKIITSNLGHTVTTLTNGTDALLSASQKVYDLIISDVQMPNMNGNELAKHLKSMPEYRFTPLILLSSNNEKSNWVKGLDDGADDYLSKPFDPEILVAKIDANLKRFSLQKEAIAYKKNKHASIENGKVAYCTNKDHKFIIPSDLIECETITVFDEKSLYECIQENNIWLLLINDNATWINNRLDKILPLIKDNGLQITSLVNSHKDEIELERIIKSGVDDIIIKKRSFKIIAHEINARLKREITYKSKYLNGLTLAANNSPIRIEESYNSSTKNISVSCFHEPYEGLPGGDFYEIYPISEHESLIAFGDVLGKKWGAWFFVLAYIAYIRSTLKILSHNLDGLKINAQPDKILETLNKYIYKDSQLSEVFTTLSLIYINNQTSTVKIASAGSLEPLHYHKETTKVSQVASSGMLLGVLEDVKYNLTEINLKDDDRLAFYTDGYSESYKLGTDEMLGSQSLIEMLKTNSIDSYKTAKEMDGYFLKKHQIKKVDDDRTLLIISNTKTQ